MDGNGDRVYAFGNMLHTHLLGRQVIFRHIRDGKEIRPLDMNLAYDFGKNPFFFLVLCGIWNT